MIPHALDGLVIFAVALGVVLIGTLILQAACALYNKFADVGHLGPGDNFHPHSQHAVRLDGIPKLSIGHAMGVILVITFINVVVGFLISRALGARMKLESGLSTASPLAYLLAQPASILVMGVMLPTPYGRGLLIALIYTLIWLVLIVLIAMIVLAFGGMHNVG